MKILWENFPPKSSEARTEILVWLTCFCLKVSKTIKNWLSLPSSTMSPWNEQKIWIIRSTNEWRELKLLIPRYFDQRNQPRHRSFWPWYLCSYFPNDCDFHYITLSAFQTPPTPKVTNGASTNYMNIIRNIYVCRTHLNICLLFQIKIMKSWRYNRIR